MASLGGDLLWVVCGRIVGALGMLGVTAILSRALHPDDYGEFFLLVSLVAVAVAIATLGQHQMVLREIGRNPDTAYRRQVLRKSMLVVASAGVIVGLLFGFLGGNLGAGIDMRHLEDLAWPAAWWVFAAAVLRVAVEAARGLRMLSLAAFFNAESVIGGAATLLFLVSILLAAATRRDLDLAMTTYGVAAASSLSLVCVLVAIDRHLSRVRGPATSRPARVFLTSGLPVVVGALVSLALAQGSLWIVHAVLEADRVAVYGSARTLANLALVPLTMVSAALLPRIASTHYSGRRGSLEKVVRGSTTVALALSTVVLIPSLVAPEVLLGTIFGPFFAEGANALRLLAVGSLLNVISGPWGFILLQTGHHRLFMAISVCGAAFNLSLAYWCAQRWGIAGVAGAWLVGQAGLAAAGVAASRWRLGILPLPLLSLSGVVETLRSRL